MIAPAGLKRCAGCSEVMTASRLDAHLDVCPWPSSLEYGSGR